MYGLLVLLDADDDDGSVSIETDDDVVLQGKTPTLLQLKSSMGRARPISERSVQLWKTLRIWSTSPRRSAANFILVTSARVKEGSLLGALSEIGTDRTALCHALETEAKKILDTRRQQKKNGAKLSFGTLAPGCRAFMVLAQRDRLSLLERASLHAASFPTAEFPAQIELRLRTVVQRSRRGPLVIRLMEWWDRRVVRGFLREMPREITKLELQQRIEEMIHSLQPNALPDDFGRQEPDTVDGECGSIMEQQIHLVEGGAARLKRAAVARWRARNQRNRWLRDDLAVAAELKEYDDKLIEAWSDRFDPMRHDVESQPEDQKRRQGRSLLDWSHLGAPGDLAPIRPTWSHDYLIQGIYQELADQCQVGWHPDFRDRLEIA